jgi:hypothetical protein
VRFQGSHAELNQAITVDNEQVGWLFIEEDLKEQIVGHDGAVGKLCIDYVKRPILSHCVDMI